jgi:hypothetical protein
MAREESDDILTTSFNESEIFDDNKDLNRNNQNQVDNNDDDSIFSDDDDGRQYNMCYSYTSLIIISLVFISFTWSRTILSQ